MARSNPFVSPTSSIKLDKRTREFRMLKKVRAELLAHVGGKPSAVQERLIERAAILHVRLAIMDAKMLFTRAMTDTEMRSYIFWQNSYARMLTALGVKQRSPPQPTASKLDDIIGRAA